MKMRHTNKRMLVSGLAVLLISLLAGVMIARSGEESEAAYSFPPPKDVVRQYFIAWDSRDYVNMYATISDGFKRIEPTATTLQQFREYVQSQPVAGVIIKDIKETANDGSTATVQYDVEFLLDDSSRIPYAGSFTLKYRQGDIVQGWKLIHPYGENIDQS